MRPAPDRLADSGRPLAGWDAGGSSSSGRRAGHWEWVEGTGRGPGLPGGAGGQAHDLDARRGGLQLQSAIGAGNLRAYVQGQDDAGHAALSN